MLKGRKKFDLESWPRKQNGTTVATTVMILQVAINWRSVLQINILKEKLDFEIDLPYLTEKACYPYNSWVNGAYIAYMFDRISGEKSMSDWVIIWIKFKILRLF